MEAVRSFETPEFGQLPSLIACFNLNVHINNAVKHWHYPYRVFGYFQYIFVPRLRKIHEKYPITLSYLSNPIFVIFKTGTKCLTAQEYPAW